MNLSETVSLITAIVGIAILISKEVREWRKEIREEREAKEKRLKSQASKQKKK